jgi:hypothetical protein
LALEKAMPPPAVPRISDQMPARIRARFQRCQADPDLGRRLGDQALQDFPSNPGPEPGMVDRLLAEIRALRPRVDHVILVPNRDLWMVVEEQALCAILAPERSIRLFYGPPGKMEASPFYPTFDMGRSLPLILALLAALAPASVYVRGSAQFKSEHLAAAVKAALPSLFLTFEVYDYACMLDDVFLETWGYSPELIEGVRDSEIFLAGKADFLIDKTPGEEWRQTIAELGTAPRRAYHPTLGTRWQEPPPAPAREPGPWRILCAGSMPHFKNYRPGEGFPHWAYPNIIEPIAALAREPDMFVQIYNASHEPALDHWPAFGGYARMFDPERVAYHPRISLQEIAERAPFYDFGMFLFEASEVVVDYPLQQSLPNRCMTYIAANLPIIVNTEMRHLAGLVERFQAGITIASTEIEDLPRRIRAADPALLRRGAEALYRHLVEANREALEAFGHSLSEGQQRVR